MFLAPGSRMGGGQNGLRELPWIQRAMRWSPTQRAQARTNISVGLKGRLFGLTLSAAGATATFGIAAGEAADSTGVDLMVLPSAFTKTTSAWAVGTAAGSLDTGAIAINTWYHAHEIKRVDTGVVDVLTSLSATAPTMPSNYTLRRRIGSMKTDASSQWTKFIQDGDLFQWDVGVLDINAATLSTVARTLITLPSVPSGLNVIAQLVFEGLSSGSNTAVLFTDPAITDTAASLSAYTHWIISTAGTPRTGGPFACRVNTSGQIGARGAAAEVYNVFVPGWTDTRGRFA